MTDPDAIIRRLGEDCRDWGEDRLTFELLHAGNFAVWLTKFMAFPDEFRKFRAINARVKRRFCLLHFVKRKDQLPQFHQQMLACPPATAAQPASTSPGSSVLSSINRSDFREAARAPSVFESRG